MDLSQGNDQVRLQNIYKQKLFKPEAQSINFILT